MNLKRVASLALATAMLLCTGFSSLADSEQSSVSQVSISNIDVDSVITVDFNVAEFFDTSADDAPWSPVSTTLVVYARDEENGYTVPVYRDQTDVSASSDSFKFAVGLPQTCNLLAVVTTPYGKAEQEFTYENKIVSILNAEFSKDGITDAEKENFIVSRSGLLCVNPSSFAKLNNKGFVTDPVTSAVKNGGIKTVGDFQYIYASGVLVGFINENKPAQEVREFVTDEKNSLGKLYNMWTDSFGNLSDDALSAELEKIRSGNVMTTNELEKYMIGATIREFFASTKYYKDYSKLFETASDGSNIYGLSNDGKDGEITAYNNLSDSRKDLALGKLWDINKSDAVNSYDKLKSAVKTALDYAKDADLDSGSGSGSGGGGGKKTGGSGSGLGSVSVSKPQSEVQSQTAFGDVPASAWYAAAINALYNDGIVNGKGDGNFEPASKVMREEFAQMLYKLTKASAGSSVSFADVADSDWYAPAVRTLASNGIVKGMGESFGVGVTIKRQDMAVMLYNTLVYFGRTLPTDGDVKPSDFDSVSDYAQSAVSALMSAGLFKGYEDGSFAPQNDVTRAEAAQAVYSVIKYLEG